MENSVTQTSSRARVKHDSIGQTGMEQLFQNYETMDQETFRVSCKEIIERSTGKRSTKDTFLVELDNARSKDLMLKKVTNYLLAGQGLGV